MAMQILTKILAIHIYRFYPLFSNLCGRQRAAIFANDDVYSGVVPQQPPTIFNIPALQICSNSLEKRFAASIG